MQRIAQLQMDPEYAPFASKAINYGAITLKLLWLDMQTEIHWQYTEGFAL